MHIKSALLPQIQALVLLAADADRSQYPNISSQLNSATNRV